MNRIYKFGLVALISFCSFSAASYAAEKDKTASMTQSTYKSLQKIQKLMGEDQNQQAITDLKTLYDKVEKETMDEAVVAQTFAYAELSLSDYPKAILYFKKSIELGLLPEKTDLQIRYMLAQLYASEGQYKKALVYAAKWYDSLEQVKSSNAIFMANIYAQSKQYKQAIPYVKKAISLDKSPKESWFQLLVSSQYQIKQYTQAASTLQKMIARWPNKKAYWEQLASTYLTLDRDKDVFATLQLAWRQGILDKESSVKTLIQYAMSSGVPERGARILETAIKKGQIEENEKNLAVLCSAWTQAKEFDNAIASYQRLIPISSDGEPMVRLAHLYIEKEQWDNAQDVLKKGIEKGVKKKEKAYLLLGIAYVKDDSFDAGKSALRKAAAYPKVKRQAEVWINFANQKIQARNRLAKAKSEAS
jgi:tetratricopeptide (TPR) repeat protein